MRIIKKYPNRRLYDTAISSYVTLEDIRALVLSGEEFEVQDVRSGQDLTRAVLLQIIAEHEESGGQPMLSSKMLSQLIRFYGDQLQGFMGSYLERSMQVFMDQQQQFRSQLSQLIGNTPLSMLQNVAQRNLDALNKLQQSFFQAQAEAGRKTESTPEAAPPEASSPATPATPRKSPRRRPRERPVK
ncbi:MAG: polyhydroxyalkanoate synthesis repressor PhaR [Xanthomonadales bacterium]|jgi:polyhydroxyalkanoate synthesis repressor PhaR|nr:polyhydroxyalkanoate synthesis repressor PhaR [Xanthomonadales bacterium]